MKTNKIIITTIIVVISFFYSCNNLMEYKENKMNEIDSLQSIVDSITQKLASVSADTMLDFIKMEINSGYTIEADSLSSEFGAFMDLKKFFIKKMQNKLGELQQNAAYSHQQLENLKHDIPTMVKNGDTALINKYSGDEAKAVDILINETSEFINLVERNKKAYLDLKKKRGNK